MLTNTLRNIVSRYSVLLSNNAGVGPTDSPILNLNYTNTQTQKVTYQVLNNSSFQDLITDPLVNTDINVSGTGLVPLTPFFVNVRHNKSEQELYLLCTISPFSGPLYILTASEQIRPKK